MSKAKATRALKGRYANEQIEFEWYPQIEMEDEIESQTGDEPTDERSKETSD